MNDLSVKDVFENPGAYHIIDVREPDEYTAGHVAGSTLIPLGQIALTEIEASKPIAVICRSGNRSGLATTMLQRRGLAAHNVAGGMLAWAKAGYPMEAGR